MWFIINIGKYKIVPQVLCLHSSLVKMKANILIYFIPKINVTIIYHLPTTHSKLSTFSIFQYPSNTKHRAIISWSFVVPKCWPIKLATKCNSLHSPSAQSNHRLFVYSNLLYRMYSTPSCIIIASIKISFYALLAAYL